MFVNGSKKSFRRIATSARRQKNVKIRDFKDIPGPTPLPLIGNIWRYFPVIGNYSFDKLHQTYHNMFEQFGPLVREKLFRSRTLVHVFDPKDMQTVYGSDGNKPVRVSHRALANYRIKRPEMYNGPGLFPSNGEEWYRFRRLFQKILLAPETTAACSSAIDEVTADLICKIKMCVDTNSEMDLQSYLFRWAIECVGVIVFNRRLSCLTPDGDDESAALVKAANDTHIAVFRTENSPFSFTSYRKLEKAQNFLSSIVERHMNFAHDDTAVGMNKSALVQKMLQIENADRKDVFTMILDMFLAGIDTTAYTLAFGLYNLAINKDVQEKLRSEMKGCLPTLDSHLSACKKDFPYLKAVVHETLRVNPVSVGTGRVIQKDLVLSGYRVPANTFLILQHQIASMQEKYFPNPSKFDPERWIRKEFIPLVSSPFGYGARMCVGKRLAQRELHTAFGRLVRSFDISYHYEKIDSLNRLINVPDKPLKLRLVSLEK